MFFPLEVSPRYSSQRSQLPHQIYSFLPTLTHLGPLPYGAKLKSTLIFPNGQKCAPRYSTGWAGWCTLLPYDKGMTVMNEITFKSPPSCPQPLPLNQMESESDPRGEE